MIYDLKSMKIIKRLNWLLKDKEIVKQSDNNYSFDFNFTMNISRRGQMQL
jgi:hypothetical protein